MEVLRHFNARKPYLSHFMSIKGTKGPFLEIFESEILFSISSRSRLDLELFPTLDLGLDLERNSISRTALLNCLITDIDLCQFDVSVALNYENYFGQSFFSEELS